jgi:tRNA modification GTPase
MLVEINLGEPLGVLPASLCVWPDERAYTRQPTVEFHVIGATPILDAVVRRCLHAGARLAEPGEFTLRAFLGGRLDLTQAEAVLGVIDAKSKKSLDVALAQLAGGLTAPLQRLRTDLINLLADLEAGLDFVDEDIEFISPAEVEKRLKSIGKELDQLLDSLQTRGTPSVRPRVVLAGLPNAGKSQLFNALVGSNAALVADVAGTTRDFVSATVKIGDQEIELIDTAGEEVAAETIGQDSQAHRIKQMVNADLVCHCLDGSKLGDDGAVLNESTSAVLQVWTKSDLLTVSEDLSNTGGILTSGVTGFGIPALKSAILETLDSLANAESSVVSSTSRRCVDAMERAVAAVRLAAEIARDHAGDELIAAELRVCLDELGRVVGAIYTEDILDQVFSRFCIGK